MQVVRFSTRVHAESHFGLPSADLTQHSLQLYERTGLVASEDSEDPIFFNMRLLCAELAVFGGISRLEDNMAWP